MIIFGVLMNELVQFDFNKDEEDVRLGLAAFLILTEPYCHDVF